MANEEAPVPTKRLFNPKRLERKTQVFGSLHSCMNPVWRTPIYIYIHIYIYTHTYIYIYICTCIYAHVYLDVQKYALSIQVQTMVSALSISIWQIVDSAEAQNCLKDQMSTKSDSFWWLHRPYFEGGCCRTRRKRSENIISQKCINSTHFRA